VPDANLKGDIMNTLNSGARLALAVTLLGGTLCVAGCGGGHETETTRTTTTQQTVVPMTPPPQTTVTTTKTQQYTP
jgi:hypothetical protein